VGLFDTERRDEPMTTVTYLVLTTAVVFLCWPGVAAQTYGQPLPE